MRNSGRGEMRATRSFRLGGGAWFEKRAIAAVCVAQNGRREPLASARLQHLLADRADACSFGDDGLERVRLPGGLQHQLAAEREAEAADPLRDRRPAAARR